MTFGSLFSGIGGLDLGLERAGMVCKWQVEIDPFCRKVLTKHWPHVPKHGDIRTLKGDDLDSVDLVAGGFPCQPVSLAGQRKGEEDERWLWPEFLRIIREIQPRLALLENVPGLRSKGMGRVLGDLAESGFDAEWDCLPTALHSGHRRNRVLIVAYFGRERLSGTWKHREAAGTSRGFFIQSTAPGFLRAQPAPELVRNIHGIPGRMERIKSLGNAVVPQVAEWIGRRILECAA